MLHKKMQKFQRRLFYALVCSEDNALIENSKGDSVTNNESNTSIKIVNLTLGYSLRANGHICDVLRIIKHT
jgi:hypothetical protein